VDDAWIMKMTETLLFKFLLFKKLIHINSSLRCPLPVVEPFSLDAMFNLALLCLDHGGLWQLLQTSSFVFFLFDSLEMLIVYDTDIITVS